MQPVKEKVKDFFEIAKKQFQTKNLMASPRIVKVVISVGTGKMTRKDKKRSKLVAERIAVINGQKPASRGAKKSIASYKLREGETIGLMVTLHGKRMYEFLDRLFNITIPRMRDFRGFDKKSIDEMDKQKIIRPILPKRSGKTFSFNKFESREYRKRL